MKTCYFEHLHNPRGLAVCDLQEMGQIGYPGVYLIVRINTPMNHRGKGIASRLLEAACADADAENVTLWIDISPSDGLGYRDLYNWYVRNDFAGIRGARLVRYPIGVHNAFPPKPFAGSIK